MNDKYVKLADVKRKLRYIFKAYGVNDFVKEKIKRALNNLPYSVKGDLETTLEAADVQPVKYRRWIGIYEWAKMHDSRPSGMCIYFWCSECQTAQEKKSNFCPNCGAKMDESEDDKHE